MGLSSRVRKSGRDGRVYKEMGGANAGRGGVDS